MQLDMEKIITSQLKTNALKSLFWDQNFIGSSEFSFDCSDYTIHSLLNDKNSVLLFIETLEQSGLADRFAAHISSLIIETLQDINQFLLFDEKGRQAMKNVYLEFLDSIKQICLAEDLDEERITEVFRRHYFNIKNSLISINGTKIFEEYTESPKIAKKVCSEYTPKFQLEVLHIDIWALSEPVLDLGCGKSGSLVKYLIEQGIDAYGADRSAGDYPFLLRKDWFEIDFKADSWGSVISHMAFSNHFRHSSQYGIEQAYRRKYFEILASLKKGGEFIYAPGLPAIESELINDKGYCVYHSPVGIDHSLFSTKIKKLF